MSGLFLRAGPPPASRARSALAWMFRDRRNGRIVITQFPNIPLAVWITATTLRLIAHGTLSAVLSVTAALALAVWGGAEITRGVNPWRRFLGATVFVGLIVTLAMNG
jgi:hypothetical protein